MAPLQASIRMSKSDPVLIAQVVKAAEVNDHIDDKINRKHGWGYAAKFLLREAERLQSEIDKVPALLIYGNWDYKRCLFCKGKRGHKQGCIKGAE